MPTLREVLALLDEDFRALDRGQETVDALCCIVRAKGNFAACSDDQRHRAFEILHRLYESGSEIAEEALNRLVNLH